MGIKPHEFITFVSYFGEVFPATDVCSEINFLIPPVCTLCLSVPGVMIGATEKT